MYDELIAELRQHHCDAKEDDTQEVCEECSYDVIIVDKSAPSGLASVCVCGLMNRAADAIEKLVGLLRKAAADTTFDAMQAVKLQVVPPQWISVEERLPEKDGCYLVAMKNDHQRRYSKTAWFSHDSWFARQNVTHWMPLPEPPKEE